MPPYAIASSSLSPFCRPNIPASPKRFSEAFIYRTTPCFSCPISSDDAVVFPDNGHFRVRSFRASSSAHPGIGDNNDCVARLNQPCRRPVQADDAAAPFPRNNVRFQPGAVVVVDDLHFFVGQ